MSVEIGFLHAEVPIVLPPRKRGRKPTENPNVSLEIHTGGVTVWDNATYTDCSEVYKFSRGDRFGFKYVIEMPFFDQVFRYLAAEYAACRNNPIGEYLSHAIRAMEIALAERDGSSVYFAGAANRVKIGWSKQVATRIAQLQTGNADPIKLLGTVPGARAREQEIQRQFAHCRVNGEWFEATPDLLAFIGSAS